MLVTFWNEVFFTKHSNYITNYWLRTVLNPSLEWRCWARVFNEHVLQTFFFCAANQFFRSSILNIIEMWND